MSFELEMSCQVDKDAIDFHIGIKVYFVSVQIEVSIAGLYTELGKDYILCSPADFELIILNISARIDLCTQVEA